MSSRAVAQPPASTAGYWGKQSSPALTMWHHCGAAHSCSSFADLDIKNSQLFKEKIALNRWIFFMN
jgi:hypothetical protein